MPYEDRALKKIHELSYELHTLLEVRDVRIPASSHHPSMQRLARHRKHLICYTHADLIDQATSERVADWTRESWPEAEFVFVDSREQRGNPE
eukprot:5472420-Prymnesium_polylepis.1